MNIVDENYCRICQGKLEVVYDLGEMFISSFVEKGETVDTAPLVLAECDECGLVQLKHTVNADNMYRQYWYRSNLNSSMRRDLKDVVTSIEKRTTLKDGDIVVDIGCNDGTMFDFYSNQNLWKVGYDPALNLKEETEKRCNVFHNSYFSIDEWDARSNNKAKVVTAIAMFYDLPDPNKFVADVEKILAPDGMFVIQFTDLLSTIKNTMVDSICHEHLEYYKLSDIVHLMRRHGLEVFDVEYNNVNGGSIRVYISRLDTDDWIPYTIVTAALANEKHFFSLEENSFASFRNHVILYKDQVTQFLSNFNKVDVYALAASTKGNYLIQLFGLEDNISAIGEINKDKFGLYTGGTNIPVVPEEEVLKTHPFVIIILAWGFTETFDNLLKDYMSKGGLVLYPLPIPQVHTDSGGFLL